MADLRFLGRFNFSGTILVKSLVKERMLDNKFIKNRTNSFSITLSYKSINCRFEKLPLDCRNSFMMAKKRLARSTQGQDALVRKFKR